MNDLLTKEEIKRELKLRGVTIAQWARAHSFPLHNVYAVLAGRSIGQRGVSHEISIALGLKPKPDKSGRYRFLDLTNDARESD